MLPPLRNKAASAYFSRRPAAIESGNFKTAVAQYNDFLKEKCQCSLDFVPFYVRRYHLNLF